MAATPSLASTTQHASFTGFAVHPVGNCTEKPPVLSVYRGPSTEAPRATAGTFAGSFAGTGAACGFAVSTAANVAGCFRDAGSFSGAAFGCATTAWFAGRLRGAGCCDFAGAGVGFEAGVATATAGAGIGAGVDPSGPESNVLTSTTTTPDPRNKLPRLPPA